VVFLAVKVFGLPGAQMRGTWAPGNRRVRQGEQAVDLAREELAVLRSGLPFELRCNQCGGADSPSCMWMPANR
jgi:hypothetical protein